MDIDQLSTDVIYKCAPSAYVFLFQKNLAVTNIQYGELLSLLRWHKPESKGVLTASRGGRKIAAFYRDSLLPGGELDQELFESLCSSLQGLFIIEPFFTSCIVNSPWPLDLVTLVEKTGYIHSAGPLIHHNQLTETNRPLFVRNLKDYIEATYPPEKSDDRVLVQFYTDESYPGLDWKAADEDEGLKEIKLARNKSFFGWNTILSEIQSLQEDLANLATLDERYYANVAERGEYIARPQTIFIYRDFHFSNFESQIAIPRCLPLEEDQWFICYDSQVRKNNRIHLADEEKSYWAGPVTTPQRLVASMINLAPPTSENDIICDPFVGTGTTILEARKWPCTIVASDLFETSLVKDNIEFFDLSSEDLHTLQIETMQLLGNEKILLEMHAAIALTLESPSLQSFYPGIKIPLDLVFSDLHSDHENETQSEIVDRLRQISDLDIRKLSHRIAIYVTRRIQILQLSRYLTETGLNVSGDVLTRLSKSEIDRWNKYMTEIIKIRLREEEAQRQGSRTIDGHFARHAPYRVDPDSKLRKAKVVLADAGNLEHLESNSVYMLIADPPYGFNKSIDAKTLLDLYHRFINEVFRVLNQRHSHIVMCTVAGEKTGKYVPAFCRKDFLLSMILAKAHADGWVVQYPSGSWPQDLFGPPYYWRSKRGVDRIIIHLSLHKP